MFGVSVIIPAFNAAGTLQKALESIRAQTFADWEAIIVDDGSTDGTLAKAQALAQEESRIRVVSQDHLGASTARNRGIELSRFNWLLFLDADDWVKEKHLDRMIETIRARPSLDLVHCGWERAIADGGSYPASWGPDERDLFPPLARFCRFAIHAAVVRKSIVQGVGGFDPTLETCEEWDLWQRVARAGVEHGSIRDVLAVYRVRLGSASMDPARVLTDGLRVIATAHAPDPRVPKPHPAHAEGMPPEEVPGACLEFASWVAGLALGRGRDPTQLLRRFEPRRVSEIDPELIAHCLFEGSAFARGASLEQVAEGWTELQPRAEAFLDGIEAHARSTDLAVTARAALEAMVLRHRTLRSPAAVGSTYGVRLDITRPIEDLKVPRGMARVRCTLEFNGEGIGAIELPPCDGLVSAYVLNDAIAAAFAWDILGRFFSLTLYEQLEYREGNKGLDAYRAGLPLAEGLSAHPHRKLSQLHERAGWCLFLQELWGKPKWPQKRFYYTRVNFLSPLRRGARDLVGEPLAVVDVAQELQELRMKASELNVLVLVGGVALGFVQVPVRRGRVTPQQLRAAITLASGFELCRAVVREAIVGKPVDAGTLRNRLHGGRPSLEPADAVFPAAAKRARTAVLAGEDITVVARRGSWVSGSSAARRATVPAAASGDLLASAIALGDHVHPERKEAGSRLVVYAPEVILPPQSSPGDEIREDQSSPAAALAQPFGRAHFESLFALGPDPWHYESPYEVRKYEQTLSLIPSDNPRALEIGCAEGHFTLRLAPRVGRLLASDISSIALARAAERCKTWNNIEFIHFDVSRDELPGQFDLIVCSEVLYFMGDRGKLTAVARKITEALKEKGCLVMAHANLLVDDSNAGGFDWELPYGGKVIGETFAQQRMLTFEKELQTPLYRIQLFRKARRTRWRSRRPALTQEEEAAPPPLHVRSTVRSRRDRRKAEPSKESVSQTLPILLYHHVAPEGSPRTRRYRVSPGAFERQLRYLADCGFRTASLEQWRVAVENKQPLEGRPLIITFDDGYRDFRDYAWPLLRRYGFGGFVFLPSTYVGQSNRWDEALGEVSPLLSWQEARALHAEGVDFGSHTLNHRRLTALSPEDIVREAARSRVELYRRLDLKTNALAYPYGSHDPIVEHLAGACGYEFGLTCRSRPCEYSDPLLSLPRIEVRGDETFDQFVRKLR